jgi:hypothetical protein
MKLTDDDADLLKRAREIGATLRAGTSDRDRLAGWIMAELVTLAERLPDGLSAVTILNSQLAQAARLAEVMTASHELPDPWTVQDVIGVALSRGLLDLEQAYVKDDGGGQAVTG